jgi:hypothetical protein
MPAIAISWVGVRTRADDLSRTLGRIWVSCPRRLGGLGLRAIPAIPVDIPGTVESLFRLANRLLQNVPAKQGLSNEYTIQDRTATAYEWMYGVPLGQKGTSAMRKERALARLGEQLAADPAPVLRSFLPNQLSRGEAPAESGTTPEQVHLDDPRQFSMAWTNFDGTYEDAKPWEEFYAASLTNVEAANAQFWPTLNQGGNPFNLLILRKVARFASGTLYVIDLNIFRAVQPHVIDGIDRFTPATKTWLWQDPETKALRPVYIRVSGYQGEGAQSFMPKDPAWLYALQAAKTSLTVYGIWLGHAFQWHIVSGAIQMTLNEVLPAAHPLCPLLAPQSKYNMAFNNILFLLWLEIGPPTSIESPAEFLALSDRFSRAQEYFDNDPRQALNNLGIEMSDFSLREPWDQFPVVGYYLEVWDATQRYVGSVVDATYSSDGAIVSDGALRSWVDATGHPWIGNVRGFPPVRTRRDLKRVLTSYLYRITIHGMSRFHATLHPALSFGSNFPPCLHKRAIPRPYTEISTQELLSYLPTTDTIGKYVDFLYFFIYSEPYERFVPDQGIARDLFFPGGLDDPRNKALIRYRLDILNLASRFDPSSVRASQWPANIET